MSPTSSRHDAKELGVTVTGVTADYGVAMRRSRKVSEQNSKGVEFLMKKHKVTVIKGTGSLGKEPDRPGRVPTEYQARKAVVIATGSRVKGIPQIGLEINKTTVISSDEALFLEQAPKTMAVIGAGAVGCEFADIFNAFGTKVTLIEALPRILPMEDAESSDALAKSYRKRGITVYAGAKVTKADGGEGQGDAHRRGRRQDARPIEVEKVLMAAGRAVNTEAMGFEEAGVKLTDRGFVKVDPRTLQTTAPGVYCIGDVAGPPMLAHKGSREGVNVAELIAGQHPHPIRYDNVPSVTYCHPEVASIGLTEEQVQGKEARVPGGPLPLQRQRPGPQHDETEGFVKIIRDKKYGEILGAHIVGSHASEMIHELVVARENEYTVEEVDLAIHAHPTLSEAIAEAALDSMGRVIHI